MDSNHRISELSLDEDVHFNLKSLDEDEGEHVVEEKPLINEIEAEAQNECFTTAIEGDIKSGEEDGKYKFYVKCKTGNNIEHENEEYCQNVIKSEELTIKHEKDDSESNDDICSQFTEIVAVNSNPVPIGNASCATQTISKGTLALRHLKEGVQLGPYEGHTTSSGGYSWKLRGGRLMTQKIAAMDSNDQISELSLDEDVHFKVEAIDEGLHVVEEKPLINEIEAEAQNECFTTAIEADIKSGEEDRKYKFYVKCETGNNIEHEELTIKHEVDDSKSDDDICSQFTEIVAVNSNPVPIGTVGRAAQTIPKGTLALMSSDVSGSGVYTLRHLNEGVQLGPYEGHTIKVESTGGYSWKLSGGRLVDQSDETSSNYLRYVNYARDASEQNLMTFQCNGELYYRTCRNIKMGEELLIYFEDNPGKEFYKPGEENCEEVYMCQFCHLGLKFEEHRDKHQIFCKIRTSQHHAGSLGKPLGVWNVHMTEDKGSQIEPVASINNFFSYAKNIDSSKDTRICQEKTNSVRGTDCSYKSGLIRHKLRHEQKNVRKRKLKCEVLKCTDCDYATYYKKTLNKHKLRHTLKNAFKCSHCDYKTYYKGRLNQHKLKHDQKNMLKCAYCDYETYYKSSLNKHKLRHDQKNILKCADCAYKTYYKRRLDSHQLRCHQKNALKCTDCDYETYDKYNLNTHKLRHDQKITLKCTDCDYETHYKYLLNKHKLRHNMKNALKCADCGYETYYKSHFIRHKLRHDQKNVKMCVKCTDCDYETYCESRLNVHKLKHNQKNAIKCVDCNYETYTIKNLNNHKIKHNQKNAFKCVDCNYETYNSNNLNNHKIRHNPKNLRKCTNCDYETYYKSRWNKHILTHDQKNVLNCANCDYETFDKRKLSAHKLKHDQNNMFKCADCCYETYCKNNLNSHKLKHTQNVLKCAHCDYETCHKRHLDRHKSRHNQKNVLKCTDCDFETYYKGRLNQHKLSHDQKNALKCAVCNYETHYVGFLNRHKSRHGHNKIQVVALMIEDV